MPTIKTYITETGKSVVFDLGGGKHKTIHFKSNRTFATREKTLQDAIEKSPFFSKEDIQLKSSFDVKEKKENAKEKEPVGSSGTEPKEYPEVTTINDAVAILKAEPYNVDSALLKGPEDIISIASDCKVSFPNLEIEE